MKTRPATVKDARGMSVVLVEVFAMQNSDRDSSLEYICEHYIEHPDRIQCTIALDDEETILGFQSLRLATKGNRFGVTPGWGIIGSYVRPDAGRSGIGSALFAATMKAAQLANLSKIDATIGADNKTGLGYYEAMGFRTYVENPDKICKVFEISD